MGFNLDNYETVEDRLARFWADHAGGRISTSIHHYDDTKVVFRAEIYFDANDQHPKAVGYAEEVRGASPVNKTSHVENAETSAIGRGLANCGYAPKGARPSREEMEKVARGSQPIKAEPENSLSISENLTALRAVTQAFNATEVFSPNERRQVNERPGANRVRNTSEPATRPQIGKIIGLSMGQNYSKAERLEIASANAGREIKDLSELTKGEASDLIGILEAGAKK